MGNYCRQKKQWELGRVLTPPCQVHHQFLRFHDRNRLAADIEREPVLLDKARLDYDTVAWLHAADEIGELVLVPVLPDPLSDKPVHLIAAVPGCTHEPISPSVFTIVVRGFGGRNFAFVL